MEKTVFLDGFIEEESRSWTGRHIARKLVLVLLRDNGIKPASKLGDKIVSVEDARPTYARGWAKKYRLALGHGDYVIQVSFVRNLWGRVKGVIEVYNHKGEMVYRALYKDRELRRSRGNLLYAWIVRLVTQKLRIPVSKTMLGDEGK